MSQYYLDAIAKVHLQLMKQEEQLQAIEQCLEELQKVLNRFKEGEYYAAKRQSSID